MLGNCEHDDCMFRDESGCCNYMNITGHAKLKHIDTISPVSGPDCAYYANGERKKEAAPMRAATWDKARAKELWLAGKSDREIAEAVGTTKCAVINWRQRSGLTRASRAPAEEAAEKVVPPAAPAAAEPEPAGPVKVCLELNGGLASLCAPDRKRAGELWEIVRGLIGG